MARKRRRRLRRLRRDIGRLCTVPVADGGALADCSDHGLGPLADAAGARLHRSSSALMTQEESDMLDNSSAPFRGASAGPHAERHYLALGDTDGFEQHSASSAGRGDSLSLRAPRVAFLREWSRRNRHCGRTAAPSRCGRPVPPMVGNLLRENADWRLAYRSAPGAGLPTIGSANIGQIIRTPLDSRVPDRR